MEKYTVNLLSIILIVCASLLLITSCQNKIRGEHEIIVGTIAGPETDLMKVAQQVAMQRFNLKLSIVEFEDYIIPNQALADGTIDANMFQHQPYLDATIKMKNYAIESIGKSFVYPMAAYSKKYKNLTELPTGATIAIPNDPSNEARALLLLASQKLIKLSHMGDVLKISPADISSNSKKLKFISLDAAQLPRSLNDVAMAIINTNYALPAGLSPSKNALAIEDKNSIYANIIVIRSEDKQKLKYKQLIQSLQSTAVKNKAGELFKGEAIAAW